MNIGTMKVEVETETCCVCGETGEELLTPEEHDAGAPPSDPPLKAVLLHLSHSKTVPSGRLCVRCICKAQDAYSFSTSLAAKGPPPLSEKIRALRTRLHELTQKIDVFIVVGGGANGAYSEEDIIMVEKEALAAAASADRDHLVKARSLRGDHCYQCTVCPRTFQRATEYRSHVESHGPSALHSCWLCGLQFSTHEACVQHAEEHAAGPAVAAGTLVRCYLCQATFQSAWELREHEASCPSRCPQCAQEFPSRGVLRAHVTLHDTVCGECLRVFPSAYARAAHALAHRQPRHYLCGYDGCILRFATRANLMSHLRKCHGSGEGPEAAAEAGGAAAAGAPGSVVPCQSCDRTFGSTAAMRRHARVHLKARTRALRDQQEESMEWSVGGGDGGEEYLEVETLEDMEETVLG